MSRRSKITAANSRLKIGLVLDSSLDLEDGVQQYVMAVGEWLRREGHDVHYLVGQTESRQLPNIHSLSKNMVASFNGNKINFPLWAKSKVVRKLLENEKFDVLHVQTPHHPLMAQQIIRLAPKTTAIVASFHILPNSRLVTLTNTFLGWLLKPSLKRIDTMLAVSPGAAQFEAKTFGLPARVSPNVFDYSFFHDAKPFDSPKNTQTILFFGRLVPRKGCVTLLQAVQRLAEMQNVPAFRVIICGKGELEHELKSFVAQHKLQDQVEFTGFVSNEDKPRYYATADISVFPSYGGESFGIVLLEAMASGQSAVLAGDNPGYASVMEPQPDLIFSAKDDALLADKILSLLHDQARRQEFAAWGERYSSRFDVGVVGKELVQIYRDVIAAKNMQ
ncbi:glycosyltransferase family 4 protein [Candidatus Saccharibacteria bacterium]|nr:glycosyltransferase family 4 protein [Candidatus Saccharibacteria bacterium]